MIKTHLSLLLILTSLWGLAQPRNNNIVMSGYIRDSLSGETLIGATLYIEELRSGTISNEYGFYSIAVKPGKYTIQCRYIGFLPQQKVLSLTKGVRLSFALVPQVNQLQEIVVESNKESEVANIEMSTGKIQADVIKKMPAFMGEPDVIKSLLMLPGVTTASEISSNLNVRGGGSGHNLLLMDEAPVYNPSHVFGFFSVFNPDAVKNIKLYKGAVPARYGGALASILDVHMKEGNNKHFAVNAGVGSIFSRLAVEGPIVKDKGSFIVAARRSYFDVLFGPFITNFPSLYFYDLTMKANYTINKNNKIYVSGYFGRDVFSVRGDQGFTWGSITSTVRWNHLYSDRLFSNTTFSYSQYDYKLVFPPGNRNNRNNNNNNNNNGKSTWKSSISNFILKPHFSYFITDKNELDFGADIVYYNFLPGSLTTTSDIINLSVDLEKKYNLEIAAFVSNQLKIGRIVELKYGLRFSYFQSFGPGTVYQYGDPLPKIRRRFPLYGKETSYKEGESISSYINVEPRVAFNVRAGERSSIKGSYNRMVQYLHFISNSVASSPLNVWVPSSKYIKPKIGDQFTLGYFRNVGKNKELAISLEGYYRQTKNNVSYVDGADILLNKYLEGDLLIGEGRAYGAELFIQKKKGRVNGWIGYTLARTELKIDGINNGDWYPARYDQSHNIKMAVFYTFNKRWSISANFVYLSGPPTTFPTSKYYTPQQDFLLIHNAQSSRNNARIPHYSRLDLSVRLNSRETNRHGKKRRILYYWDFSLYNVYNRQNPFDISFFSSPSVAKQLSIIGSIFPAVSVNLKFTTDKNR